MLITLLAFVFVLSIVIVVHEFGHFIVAKKLGIFVKVFSLGFGRKIVKKRFGETVYAISALPFGGYVKFAGETESGEAKEAPRGGDADEITDADIDPKRYFVNKRPLVRSAVVFAGPFANYVLTILILVGMLTVHGQSAPIGTTTILEVMPGSPADSVGLRRKDVILKIDGEPVVEWAGVHEAVWKHREGLMRIEILRDQDTLAFELKSAIKNKRSYIGVYPYTTPIIGVVKRDGPAYRVGMRPGAVVEAINDTTIAGFDDIARICRENPSVPLAVRWTQGGVQHTDSIIPVPKRSPKEGSKTEYEIVGEIGVGPRVRKERVPLPRAVLLALETPGSWISQMFSGLGLLFERRADLRDVLGGPILIAQVAGETARWGFDHLMNFLAVLSLTLCVFNLLPMLPFDGGHLVLHCYEGVARRPVNRRLRDILTQAGFVLLVALMILVVVLDLSRCASSLPGFF